MRNAEKSAFHMGASVSTELRPEDIHELEDVSGRTSSDRVDLAVTPGEIRKLYNRFVKLDRGSKGLLTRDDLLMVPEFSMNPVARRVIELMDGARDNAINFKSFLATVSIFSQRAQESAKRDCEFATSAAPSHTQSSSVSTTSTATASCPARTLRDSCSAASGARFRRRRCRRLSRARSTRTTATGTGGCRGASLARCVRGAREAAGDARRERVGGAVAAAGAAL
jgi:hypothetical protein